MELYHEVQDTELPDNCFQSELDSEHPLYDMWQGYQLQLCEYGLIACEEWSVRRSKLDPFYNKIKFHLECATTEDATFSKPNWFGDVDFHYGHQAALVRINPLYYSAYFKVDKDRELVWPVSDYAS
jgi:hypothetical protein